MSRGVRRSSSTVSARGIDLSGAQQTTTRTILGFFAGEPVGADA
jgi:hypothetical protein